MKKLIIFASLLTLVSLDYGQTNIFPPSGNVGIGTISPGANLQVGDGTGASVHYGGKGMVIKFASGDRALLELHDPSAANKLVMQSLAGQSYFGSITSKPLFIQSSGGNVGIGVFPGNTYVPPGYQLDLRTSTPEDGISITQGSSGSSALHLNNYSTGGNHWGVLSSGLNSSQGSGNFSIYQYGVNSDRLFINGSNGRVGINTTSPAYKLDVGVTNGNDGIAITQSGSQASALHMENTTSGGNNWALFATGNGNTQGSGNFSIYEYGSVGTPINQDRFFINGANGNVGIGSVGPQHKLSVYGNVLIGTDFSQGGIGNNNFEIRTDGVAPVKRGITTSSSNGDVNFYLNGGASPGLFNFKETSTGSSLVNINANGSTSITCYTGADAFMIVDGASGINNFKVKRSGTVYAREIFVQLTPFPDYVFSKEYKLMPLANLESYIKENHHLPNVPTASEVEKEGANLGELNKIQMEKIEELTLYVIELKKEIDILKAK